MRNYRTISYAQAIKDAQELALSRDPSVFVIGEGVPDPKGIFGTTVGLAEKFPARVLDMPVSENGMTGICIGAAISGMRPILVHQRMDFTLYSFDQIVNNAAKWYFMFGGQEPVPMVIRMIIGRGWGPGPQHSQSLQALFGHIPGLKVVMPATVFDAKGLFISAIEDNNPVIFIEHRWLHNLTGNVPKGYYTVPIGKAKVIKKGTDITIVATSFMLIETLRIGAVLEENGVSAEIVDVRSIRPFDSKTILTSVAKTRRLIVSDTGWKTLGFAAEVLAQVTESGITLKNAAQRITIPDMPTPTSWKLAADYYPTSVDILRAGLLMCEKTTKTTNQIVKAYKTAIKGFPDQPDPTFTGPF